ncbi:hypothetical protein [Gracilibacillus timonensis]|uniref:hypothetical protein n=1 Tax=Gracilibacillus timonensis TaxID=1816696 RepID=UPI000826306C|nr:hypothetical protein [Gracilibacillus timonensis]
MKQIFYFILLAIFLVACGNQDSAESSEDVPEETTSETESDMDEETADISDSDDMPEVEEAVADESDNSTVDGEAHALKELKGCEEVLSLLSESVSGLTMQSDVPGIVEPGKISCEFVSEADNVLTSSISADQIDTDQDMMNTLKEMAEEDEMTELFENESVAEMGGIAHGVEDGPIKSTVVILPHFEMQYIAPAGEEGLYGKDAIDVLLQLLK